LGSKPTDFPMEGNHKLAFAKRKVLDDPSRYKHLVGRLIYLTITRPELCYAVHILSQFMKEPKEEQYGCCSLGSQVSQRYTGLWDPTVF